MKNPIPTWLLAVALVAPAPASAANYPLEITNIRAAMSPNNRIMRAYPGIEYNIRAAVVGGAYPYTYSLSGAPDGMVINPATGEISWPKPSADANPTLTVVDSEGTRASAAWTIKVTSTGFRFVDAVQGKPAEGNGCVQACGTGAFENPWRTIADMSRGARPGDFVYFKTGSYGITDMNSVRPGSDWEHVKFEERVTSVVWLSYPGQTPRIDFVLGALIRFAGENVYVDGFETTNSRTIGFQWESESRTGPTFRRLRMSKLGPGINGTNAAFIMTTTTRVPSSYMVVQDCEFSGAIGYAVTIKIYAQEKLLIEDTVHRDSRVAIELKDDIRQFTVRGNRIDNVERTGIGGNMHETTTHGEILFNYVRAGVALDLNQNGMARQIFVHRNTFVGVVQIRNTDSEDGPFLLKNNVILSPDSGYRGSRVSFSQVADPSRATIVDNLVGSPNEPILQANGDLTPGNARHIGTRGHQIAAQQRRPR